VVVRLKSLGVSRRSSVARTGEGGASEQTLLALYGWMSRKMLETYSRTRIEAKRQAVAVFDPPENSEGGTKGGTVQ
jgi:hypothetical protein